MKAPLIILIVISVVLVSCVKSADKRKTEPVVYACPMHPQILKGKPGNCPLCGMALVRKAPATNESIMLDQRQIELANITVGPAKVSPIENDIVLGGKLMFDQQSATVISSRITGWVEKLFLSEKGRLVKKGDPLYQIYSPALQSLEQEFILTTAEQQKVDEKTAVLNAAAERKLRLAGLTSGQIGQIRSTGASSTATVLSGTAGVITAINITEGQTINEGEILFAIGNTTRLWLDIPLYRGEVAQLQDIVVRVQGYEHIPVKGKIIFTSPVLESANNTLMVRIEIENRNGAFYAGQQAFVVFRGKSNPTISLPADAVIHNGDTSVIWIQEKDGSFHSRNVTTGLETFGKVQITSGVQEGEMVVLTGAFLLNGEMLLRRG